MSISCPTLEDHLLETAAGQAVYDALVQANLNLKTVSLELVKQMLVVECRARKQSRRMESEQYLATWS